MTEFQVKDMTCGHCVETITRAVKAVDGSAKVAVDLQTRRVRIESAAASEDFASAIRAAGYTPVPFAARA